MTTLQSLNTYLELRDMWRDDPILYAKVRLGVNPTRQQAQLLDAIAPFGSRVSVRAGHGVGKTTALAIAAIWHLECFDDSKTPCTAPTANQLFQVLWSELAKMMARSDEQADKFRLAPAFRLSNMFRVVQARVYDRSAPMRNFVAARTARKELPDALQGYHATDLQIADGDVAVQRSEDAGSIFYVIEEASGVPDEIVGVIEGALSGKRVRLVMAGNPVRNTGFFARSHMKDRASFTCLHFRCSDSPLPAPDYRARLARKYGEDSNVVRVRADGEFPKVDDDTLIAFEHAEAALARDLTGEEDGSDLILGVDVARYGDDRTVLLLRKGRRVLGIWVHAKQGTMETVGCIVLIYNQIPGIRRIKVDVIGVGAGVVDRLKELKLPVDAVNVSEVATIPGRRAQSPLTINERRVRFDRRDAVPRTMRDYLWCAVKDWLEDDAPSFFEAKTSEDRADDDPAEVLAAELCTVKYRLDSDGKLVVESKDDMKRRGLRSPDVAEALLCTFAPDVTTSVWARL
jgi:phage terminase large subunit